PPNTNRISDKDRLASTKDISPDKATLRDLLNATRKPGTPKPSAPAPQQQAAQQVQAPPEPPAPAATPAPAQPTQQAQLEAPKPKKSPFAISSPGTSTSDAIRVVANGHASGIDYGPIGDYGKMLHPDTKRTEGMEILSDTLGVDFGPYMKRLHFA